MEFHYNEIKIERDIKTMVVDTSIWNPPNEKNKNPSKKQICKGYAHAGMMIAALDKYKDLTKLLNNAFEKFKPDTYNLVCLL